MRLVPLNPARMRWPFITVYAEYMPYLYIACMERMFLIFTVYEEDVPHLYCTVYGEDVPHLSVYGEDVPHLYSAWRRYALSLQCM